MDLLEARILARQILEDDAERQCVLLPNQRALIQLRKRLAKWRRPETLHKLSDTAAQLYQWQLDEDPAFRRMSNQQRLAWLRNSIGPTLEEPLPGVGAPLHDAQREAGFVLLRAWLSANPGKKVTWTKYRFVKPQHLKPGQRHYANGTVDAPSLAMRWLEAEFRLIYEQISPREGFVKPGPAELRNMADNVIRKFRRSIS